MCLENLISSVNSITVQSYILCIYLANFLPFFFEGVNETNGTYGTNGTNGNNAKLLLGLFVLLGPFALNSRYYPLLARQNDFLLTKPRSKVNHQPATPKLEMSEEILC